MTPPVILSSSEGSAFAVSLPKKTNADSSLLLRMTGWATVNLKDIRIEFLQSPYFGRRTPLFYSKHSRYLVQRAFRLSLFTVTLHSSLRSGACILAPLEDLEIEIPRLEGKNHADFTSILAAPRSFTFHSFLLRRIELQLVSLGDCAFACGDRSFTRHGPSRFRQLRRIKGRNVHPSRPARVQLTASRSRPRRSGAKRRRAEILQLFETNVYGHSPKPPKQIRFKVFDLDKAALGGKAIRKQVTIYFPTPKGEAHEDLLMYIPADAPKPVPVILVLNFGGNQSVNSDPGIKLATIWIGKPPVRQQAPEDSRGRDKEFEIEKILARGYGFATVCYQDIEPDFQGGYKQGIRQLFLKPARRSRAG